MCTGMDVCCGKQTVICQYTTNEATNTIYMSWIIHQYCILATLFLMGSQGGCWSWSQLHVGECRGHPRMSHDVSIWGFTYLAQSPLLPGHLPSFVSTGNWERCPSQLSYHCSISVYSSITKRKKVENLTPQFKWQCLISFGIKRTMWGNMGPILPT